MDDNLLAHSNADTLEKMFKETQRIMPGSELQIVSEKNVKRKTQLAIWVVKLVNKKFDHKRYRSIETNCKFFSKINGRY